MVLTYSRMNPNEVWLKWQHIRHSVHATSPTNVTELKQLVLQAGVSQNSSIEITTGNIWLQLLLLMGVQPDTGCSSISSINYK